MKKSSTKSRSDLLLEIRSLKNEIRRMRYTKKCDDAVFDYFNNNYTEEMKKVLEKVD